MLPRLQLLDVQVGLIVARNTFLMFWLCLHIAMTFEAAGFCRNHSSLRSWAFRWLNVSCCLTSWTSPKPCWVDFPGKALDGRCAYMADRMRSFFLADRML